MKPTLNNKTKEQVDAAVKRVVDLARDLPCLKDAPGIDPFDPTVLDDWVSADDRTAMQVQCGQLVLTAFHPFHNWRCGQFNLDVASWVWDEVHNDGFTRWARNPVFVYDSMVPPGLWDEPPNMEEAASRMGKPCEELEGELAEIRRKLGVRDQRELTRFLKVISLLSRGSDESDGHA